MELVISVVLFVVVVSGILLTYTKEPPSALKEYSEIEDKDVSYRTTAFEWKGVKPKYIDYYKYITSADWKFNSNRLAVLEYDNRCCRLCKDTYNIQVHHITYDNLGSEEFEDLITLCQPCHNYTHTVAGKGAKTYPPIKA